MGRGLRQARASSIPVRTMPGSPTSGVTRSAQLAMMIDCADDPGAWPGSMCRAWPRTPPAARPAESARVAPPDWTRAARELLGTNAGQRGLSGGGHRATTSSGSKAPAGRRAWRRSCHGSGASPASLLIGDGIDHTSASSPRARGSARIRRLLYWSADDLVGDNPRPSRLHGSRGRGPPGGTAGSVPAGLHADQTDPPVPRIYRVQPPPVILVADRFAPRAGDRP